MRKWVTRPAAQPLGRSGPPSAIMPLRGRSGRRLYNNHRGTPEHVLAICCGYASPPRLYAVVATLRLDSGRFLFGTVKKIRSARNRRFPRHHGRWRVRRTLGNALVCVLRVILVMTGLFSCDPQDCRIRLDEKTWLNIYRPILKCSVCAFQTTM